MFLISIYDPITSLIPAVPLPVAILVRLAISLVIAAIVGCERSSKRHSAGLRTFILICVASTIAMMIDLTLIGNTDCRIPLLSAITILSTAMLSGNSILFSSKNQIKGLTTSAGLWSCSIIGLTIGAGLYTLTLISSVALLFILAVLPRLERYLKNRSNHFEFHLELKNKSNLQDFVTTIRKLGLRIDDIESNPAYVGSGLSVYSVTITISSSELKKYKSHVEIIEALASLDYVNHIEEMQ
ncbi:MAG: MgtC/SapB family protein [Clostridia bacterium]|nr:MgtC/SapB family protein [Clostridia bacterium]